MTSNNIPDEFPKKETETITYFTIGDICKMTKKTRIKIARAIWNL